MKNITYTFFSIVLLFAGFINEAKAQNIPIIFFTIDEIQSFCYPASIQCINVIEVQATSTTPLHWVVYFENIDASDIDPRPGTEWKP